MVRHVDEDLVPHEVILGFFTQANGTTGEALSAMLLDCFFFILVCHLRIYVDKPMMEQAAVVVCTPELRYESPNNSR